ncbi:MAG: hypothetical protein DRJ03_00615 [Chloroflexi bacterium]|nr:MAG: hypothetical protein DRJ03_00615 [Chloroflexota bacterium]
MASFFGSGNIFIAGTMAASGFLRSGDVIYYHPLDNYDEGVQSDAWLGSAGFDNAIISSGIGSATLGGPTVAAVANEHTDLNHNGQMVLEYLPISGDDNRFITVFASTNGKVLGRVVTVDDDAGNMTLGAYDSAGDMTYTMWRSNLSSDIATVHISGSRDDFK